MIGPDSIKGTDPLIPDTVKQEDSPDPSQLLLLPQEMIGEILDRIDFKSKLNLSLVSKKIRCNIQQIEHKAKQIQIHTIFQNIQAILNLGNPLHHSIYNKITNFVLETKGFDLARKFFLEFDKPTENISQYLKFTQSLVQQNKFKEINNLINEFLDYFLRPEEEDEDFFLLQLNKILISARYYQLAKIAIYQMTIPLRCSKALDLAERYIELQELNEARKILKELETWFESIPDGCLRRMAWLHFQCKDIKTSLKLLAKARKKAPARLLCLAEVYLDMGCIEAGYALIDEVKRKALKLESFQSNLEIYQSISSIFSARGYDENALLTIKQMVSLINTIDDINERYHFLNELLTEVKWPSNNSSIEMEILHEICESAIKARHILDTNKPKKEYYAQQKIDSLLLLLTDFHCRRGNYNDAKMIAELIKKPWEKGKAYLRIGNNLMKIGLHSEGKIFFQKILDLTKTTSYNFNEYIGLSLAENDYLDEALEDSQIKYRSHGFQHFIIKLLRMQIQKGNFQNAKLLLNHLPPIVGIQTDYIAPLKEIAEVLGQKSSFEERDALSGIIQEALDLVDLAKNYASFSTHYVIDMAITKAKIGDVVGAQTLLIEVREIIKSQLLDQNGNKIIISGDQIGLLKDIAKLQNSLNDFKGALETLEIFKEIPSSYIEALTAIGMRKPLLK